MKFLSESTLVPLGLAVIVIGGGAIWLTTLYFQTQANAKAIEGLQQDQAIVVQMGKDIAVIKTKVEIMERRGR